MHPVVHFHNNLSTEAAVDRPLNSREAEQQQNFFRGVETWAAQEARGENRSIAAEIIKQVYKTKSTTLKLGEELQLSCLPEEIGILTNLRNFDVRNNNLSALPSSIGQLTRLEDLNIAGNKLTQLPVEIGNLENLETLDVDLNLLTHLPETIGNLSNLNILNLKSNKLSVLPDSIGNLQNLGGLHLSDNFLNTLPHTLSNIPTLTLVDASNNRIAALPETIAHIPTLMTLDLQNNQLFALQLSFKKITDLKIYGNPLADVMDSQKNLINFGSGIDKLLILLQSASIYISKETWGLENSTFINQILVKTELFFNQIQSTAINRLIGGYYQMLMKDYSNLPSVATLIKQAGDIDNLYSAENDLVFISEDGLIGLIISREFYKKNILSESQNNIIPWSQFALYQFDVEKQIYTNQIIGNIAEALKEFPLLQKSFLIANNLEITRNFLNLINLGDYESAFREGLQHRFHHVNLTGIEHQIALGNIFGRFIDGDNKIITETHFEQLIQAIPVIANVPSSALFCLATLMTNYSSTSFFGSERDSPAALRDYAVALLNKVEQIDPDLIPTEQINTYRDVLQQIRRTENHTQEVNTAFGCTQQLYAQMLDDIQELIAKGAIELKTASQVLLPQAWR